MRDHWSWYVHHSHLVIWVKRLRYLISRSICRDYVCWLAVICHVRVQECWVAVLRGWFKCWPSMQGHDDDEGSKSSFRRSRMFSKFFYVWVLRYLHVFSDAIFGVDSVVQWFLVISKICRAVFYSAAKEFLFIDRMFLAENQL